MALTRAEKADLYTSTSNVAGGNLNKAYYKHGVLYGNYFDLRIYKNVKTTFNYPNADKQKRTEGTKRDDSVARARVSLYRLVASNIGQHGRYKPIFATFTFKEHTGDINKANYNLKLYLSKLRKYLKNNPKYVAVPEQQQSGSWHFHIVFFNVPKLNKSVNDFMWNQGSYACKLEYVKNIRDTAAYLSKYLSKEYLVSRGFNKKMYYTSRGLIKPIDVFNTDTIDSILIQGKFKVLQVYEGETFSQTKYKLYAV